MSTPLEAQAEETLEDLERELLADPDTALWYQRQRWLSHTMQALKYARVNAGLTQQDVANRLGTSARSVERMENDHSGRVALHRFLDYANACGMLPSEVTFAPLQAPE